MVFIVDLTLTIVHGVYKPTHNYAAPHCSHGLGQRGVRAVRTAGYTTIRGVGKNSFVTGSFR